MTTEEPFVGVADVAALLNNMSTFTVKEWAKAGKIPGIKPGKYWLFRPSEVIAALNPPAADPWAQSPQSRARKRAS